MRDSLGGDRAGRGSEKRTTRSGCCAATRPPVPARPAVLASPAVHARLFRPFIPLGHLTASSYRSAPVPVGGHESVADLDW
ncbi:hypothetical protein GCM10022225_35850 [Plantactinospora mayteni]|uniref:Uncharacterized protein n=1 Tax=Plantactinospora mayteni TaxID=566021 RepID=A0ABQ4EMD0_9ACTN|nr:hypothetical protein Pma05_23770 [Plantactinospora mayteni]